MALNLGPSAWFPSWSATSTHVTLPISSLPGLTSVTAGAVSGDVRAVAFGFCDQLETIYFGLVAADKPAHMTVSRRDSSSASTLRTTFTIAFDTEITAQSLVSE